MALEGTLRDFSFADILQLISLQRKTGVLTLKNDENVVTISFLEGSIIGSSSLNQHPEDRIGLILLKRKEITEEELEASLKRQEETLQRLGRILIDAGMVAPDTVRQALSQQILQIIYRVFRWGDGDYHFSQETDIDYDRDLMRPLAADSIIMEGARMTDEWPFVDQRIPNRSAVFIQENPNRRFVLSDDVDDDLDNLGFNFSDTPDGKKEESSSEDRLSPLQFEVYEYVNGVASVNELIADSPFVEFDTCKALADLLDRKVIREATPQEIASGLSRQTAVPTVQPSRGVGVIPWLAVPFLVLFGFSLSVMFRNPINPSFNFVSNWTGHYLYEGVSWFRMSRMSRTAEDVFFLDGFYPEDAEALISDSPVLPFDFADPWGRDYQLATRGSHMMVIGEDAEGNQVQRLILSRPMAWEGEAMTTVSSGPGVRLVLPVLGHAPPVDQ